MILKKLYSMRCLVISEDGLENVHS